jgi:hypothetical protein
MSAPTQNHVVFFSSGKASWFAAKIIAQKFGTDNLWLVFADTTIEDPDNYRFLEEAAKNVGGQLIKVKDGRNPWDIFNEKRFINHRASDCSIELKVKPCENWINANFSPDDTVLYFGIGFEELERMEAISKNWHPFQVEAPLCWGDRWVDKQEINRQLKLNNLKQPRLYDMGFAHANCGGFCTKAGLKHYRNLLKYLPDVYAHHEQQEQEFLQSINNDSVGILRRTKNGVTKGLTLKAFREEIQSAPLQLSFDFEALGGCGCFIDNFD